MIVKRFLRKAKLPHQSYLAVVVLPTEAAAFQAYRILQTQGISPEHLAIVGTGYSSPERVGLLEPMEVSLEKAFQTGLLTGLTGWIAGLVAVVVLYLGFELPVTYELLLMVIAGGIIVGSLGALLGGLVGFVAEGSAFGIYRHHLRHGRYLLMMEGPERLVRLGQEVLSQYSVTKMY